MPAEDTTATTAPKKKSKAFVPSAPTTAAAKAAGKKITRPKVYSFWQMTGNPKTGALLKVDEVTEEYKKELEKLARRKREYKQELKLARRRLDARKKLMKAAMDKVEIEEKSVKHHLDKIDKLDKVRAEVRSKKMRRALLLLRWYQAKRIIALYKDMGMPVPDKAVSALRKVTRPPSLEEAEALEKQHREKHKAAIKKGLGIPDDQPVCPAKAHAAVLKKREEKLREENITTTTALESIDS